MVTGELAARAILDDAALDDPRRGTTAAGAYVRAWRREIGGELRDSVLIQKYLFRDPARLDGVVAGAGRHRAVGDAIIAYAMGELSYREARRFLIRRFPAGAVPLSAGVTPGVSTLRSLSRAVTPEVRAAVHMPLAAAPDCGNICAMLTRLHALAL